MATTTEQVVRDECARLIEIGATMIEETRWSYLSWEDEEWEHTPPAGCALGALYVGARGMPTGPIYGGVRAMIFDEVPLVNTQILLTPDECAGLNLLEEELAFRPDTPVSVGTIIDDLHVAGLGRLDIARFLRTGEVAL
jgi:hypothetical protein